MKVLAVIGSPRGKGNTYRVVRAIEDKMKSLGQVQFDYLMLKDARLVAWWIRLCVRRELADEVVP